MPGQIQARATAGQQMLADPEFQALPRDQQVKAFAVVDPDFGKLPEDQQVSAFDQISPPKPQPVTLQQGFGNVARDIVGAGQNFVGQLTPQNAINLGGAALGAIGTQAGTLLDPKNYQGNPLTSGFQGMQVAGTTAGINELASLANSIYNLRGDFQNSFAGRQVVKPTNPIPSLPNNLPFGINIQQVQQKNPVGAFLGQQFPYLIPIGRATGGGSLLKSIGEGAAIGALQNPQGGGLKGRVQNAITGAAIPAAFHTVLHTAPNMLKGKVEKTAPPVIDVQAEKPVSVQRIRDDAAEREFAEKLYKDLRSEDIDTQTAAQNKLKGVKKQASVRVKASNGEPRFSANPERRFNQERAQRVLAHLKNIHKEFTERARTEREIEAAKAKQARDENRQRLKDQNAADKKRQEQLKADIKARNAEIQKLERQRQQQASKDNKALNDAEKEAQNRRNQQLKAAIQERANANREANREHQKIQARITQRETLLAEDNHNTNQVFSTKFDTEKGLGAQHNPASNHLQFEDVADSVPKGMKAWASIIDKAMRGDKKVSILYKAEITGHTSTLPTKEVSPYAWFKTDKGVGFWAYNPEGHETRYYLSAGEDSSQILAKPKALDEQGFKGVTPNVYYGSRFYNIDHVLSRPERSAGVLHSQYEQIIEQNPALADYIKNNPHTPLDFLQKMAEVTPQDDYVGRLIHGEIDASGMRGFSDHLDSQDNVEQIDRDLDC